MKKKISLLTFMMVVAIFAKAQKVSSQIDTTKNIYRDLYSDTWVATDALGRTMPGIEITGPVKTNHRHVVGM